MAKGSVSMLQKALNSPFGCWAMISKKEAAKLLVQIGDKIGTGGLTGEARRQLMRELIQAAFKDAPKDMIIEALVLHMIQNAGSGCVGYGYSSLDGFINDLASFGLKVTVKGVKTAMADSTSKRTVLLQAVGVQSNSPTIVIDDNTGAKWDADGNAGEDDEIEESDVEADNPF